MKKLELSSFISKIALILLVLTTVVFTSCENFLQGEDVKEEISKAIEYNNAATYVLHLVALKGSGDIKTPAGEEVTKKVSDTFNVKFVPEDNHKFIKWEAVISGLGQNEKVSDYIEFEDEKSLETKVTFKKASNSITITPVCPELLAVKEFNFKDEGTINPRDSSIVITLNQEIPEECKSAFSISISGLPEDKTFEDYFMPAEISGKVITIKTKYSQTQEKDDLIPVDQNSSKTISITLSSEKLFYTNKEYSEENDVYLDKDVVLRYTIGSQTSKPTDVEFTYDKDQCSMHVNDIDWSSGQSMACSVGQTVSLYCKPKTGWSFCGWQFERTYTDNGVNKTELISADSLAELNLKIDYSEDTKDTYGYDTETRIAQAKLSVNNYIEGTITVSPVIFECLAVEDFNMKNADKVYPRDNPIILTFNKPVKAECLENIIVRIPGLAEGLSAMDFFKPAVISGNKVTLQADTDGKVSSMIPVPANGTVAISVIIPENNFYYEATSQTGKYNVGLYSEKTYTYTINSETTEKTLIKLYVEKDSNDDDIGTLRIGEDIYTKGFEDYSVGKTLPLSYKYSDDYNFKGWKIIHTPEGSEQSDEFVIPGSETALANLNLSVAYKDNNITQATFTVEKKTAGQIVIQPFINKIAVVSVKIDGDRGTFTPGKGTKEYKVGVKNHIEFDAASDYAFVSWKLVNAKNPEEELPVYNEAKAEGNTDNAYIRFSNVSSEKTDFEILREPDTDDISLLLTPDIEERPRIISTAPAYTAAGVLRDTTIQVMFDHDMDEESIYFTDKEIKELKDSGLTAEDFLPKLTDVPQNHYGYKKDGKIFFKNILITNSRTDENINEYFKAPIFENARTLSIPVDKANPLLEGLRVSVLVKDEVFYKKNGKNINLSRAEKWQYLVNGDIDEKAPTLDTGDSLVVKGSKNTPLEVHAESEDITVSESDIPDLDYFGAGKFDLTLKVKDDTTVDSKFIIVCEKLYDEKYTKLSKPYSTEEFPIEYTNAYGVTASYNGMCQLKGLDDGVYSLKFIVKDGSENSNTYPMLIETAGNETTITHQKFYFCMDNTAPIIAAPTVSDIDDSATSLQLNWTIPDSEKDYEEAYIEYREWDSDADFEVKGPFQKGTNSYLIENLKAGTHYEVAAIYKDFAGNTKRMPVNGGVYTRPEVPKLVSVSTEYGTKAILTCTKPDSGNFTSFRMRKRIAGGAWIRLTEDDVLYEDGVAVKTCKDLEKGFKYEFEICSYDENSGKYSLPYYTSETNYPEFVTEPNKVSNWTVNYNSYTDQGTVTLNKPANNISGYFVYCSTDEAFPDTAVTKKKKVESPSTVSSVTFSDLSAGTLYYVKVQSYYESEENVSEVSVTNTNTKCNPVSDLAYTAESNTELNVTWTAPTGVYDSYTVSYKSSSSDWTNQIVRKENTSARIVGLSGGTNYTIKVITNGLTENETSPISNCQTCPNPVSDFSAEKLDDTCFEVTWTKPDGNFSGYKLYYVMGEPDDSSETVAQALNAAEPVIISSNATSIIIGDDVNEILEVRKFYYLRMETYTGNASNPTLKTNTNPIGCSLALENVKNVRAVPVSTSSLNLSWENPDIEFDGIDIYKGNVKLTSLGNNATSYTVEGLSANTVYDFSIRIFKENMGTASALVSGRTYTDKVTNLTGEVKSPTSIELSWTNPSSGVSQVYIYKNGTYVAYSTSNTATITGLSAGTSYTFTVYTLNVNGYRNTIDYTSTSIQTSPNPVSSISCSSTTKTSVTLSWVKPSGTYTGVKVYKKLHNTDEWTNFNTYGTTYTSCEVTGLSAGNCYDFMIETYIDGVQNGGTTSQKTISSVYTKPNAPRNFSFSSRTATSLKFTWTKPASGSYSGYRLYYKKSTSSTYGSNDYVSASSTATSATISGLQAGTIYNVKLEAYLDSASNSTAYANEITKATNPGVPGNIAVQADDGNTKVSWSAPTNGASGYYVYYKTGSGSWASKSTTSTYYTFSNTALSNSTNYSFYVQAYKISNGENLNSEASTTKTFYTPPASLSITPTIISDDGMGRIQIQWQYPSGRSDIKGVNVYLDGDYKTYTTTSGTKTYTAIIDNYTRGTSYYFQLVPYHTNNSGETAGPVTSINLVNSTGDLIVNGKQCSKTSLKNILTANKTVNSHPDYGAFYSGRNVTLSKYSLGTYEVTEELYNAVVGYTASTSKFPKTWISWQQAIAFCNKLSALQGLTPCYEVEGISDWKSFNMDDVPTDSDVKWYGCKQNLKNNGYHLPTQAQWEFAARGGNPGDSYWNLGISGALTTASVPNYCVSLNNSSQCQVVGTKYANSLGLYDMSGNVWEYLTDWKHTFYGGNYTDPYCEVRDHGSGENTTSGYAMPYDTTKIVVYKTGGSYGDDSYYCSVWYLDERFYAPNSDGWSGLRLCRNVTY